MKYFVLAFCIIAGCTRVNDDILIDIESSSLLNIRDGSEVVLMVDRTQFERTAARLNGNASVHVFDNRSGEYYLYLFSAFDPSRMPNLETTESGMTIIRVRMKKVGVPVGASDNYLNGINDVLDSVCARLHFANITNVVRSKDICVKG